jgi:hypothetical protein
MLPRARKGRWPVRRPRFERPGQANLPSARPGARALLDEAGDDGTEAAEETALEGRIVPFLYGP